MTNRLAARAVCRKETVVLSGTRALCAASLAAARSRAVVDAAPMTAAAGAGLVLEVLGGDIALALRRMGDVDPWSRRVRETLQRIADEERG